MNTTAPSQQGDPAVESAEVQPARDVDPAGNVETARVQVDDPTTVETLRGQIDALDAAISRLVGERAHLSRRIQTARMNAGGTRVELGRERAIVDHYRSTLGSAGSSLAEAVLRVCRGQR